MSLITIEEAAIRYNKSQNTLTSTAAMHYSKHGRYPKWYQTIKGKQLTRIDTDEYEKLGHLERKAWVFATDSLFWAFQDLGIKQWDLGAMIAKKSKRYKSGKSWNSFLQSNLFSIPPQIISEGEKSMRIEFVQHGTRIIYEMIKGESVRYTDEQLYDKSTKELKNIEDKMSVTMFRKWTIFRLKSLINQSTYFAKNWNEPTIKRLRDYRIEAIKFYRKKG